MRRVEFHGNQWMVYLEWYIDHAQSVYDLADKLCHSANIEEMMGKLSTHVLDVAQGKPGANVALELYAVGPQGRALLKSAVTNQDGRCDAPLLQGDEFRAGRYELVFAAGDYFAAQGVIVPEPRFIDRVIIAFGIADPEQNYHVPLVVSPWSYSTYRGS